MKRSLTPDEIEYYQSQGYNMQNYKGEALEFPDESSVKGSVGRSALVSALPTAAGGAAFAGTMLALAPETFGASLLAIPAAAAVGYGGSKLASKVQEPLMSEEFKKQLAVDAQMHPYATAGGALATMPLGGFNPSPANVAKAGGALGRLALGLGTNAAERQALVNVGSGAALGGIQEAVLAPIEGRDITAKDVALAAATGGVFSRPNALGRNVYGFHDGTSRVVETPAALTKQLAPANAQQQRAPIASVQPNLTMEEYINKALVPAMNKDNTPRLSKSAETSGKNISDLLEKGADVVSRESIQADVDKRVKAILEKEQKAQKPTTEAPKAPAVPATELKTEVASALKAKNLSAALTPEYADTVIKEILNERGIQVAPDGSLPINGKAFFDEGTRKVLFNPDKAAVDTLPHEGLHHMRWDLEAAAYGKFADDVAKGRMSPSDAVAAANGDKKSAALLDAWDKLNAPEREKINAERLAAKLEPQDAHEFAVSQQGFEFVKQQLNLKRETPWKKWWNDTKALFNAKYNTGKVSLEDMRRAVNFKFVHERQKMQAQVGNKQDAREQPFGESENPDDINTWSEDTWNIVEAEGLNLLKQIEAHDKFGTPIPGLSKEAQARADAKRAARLNRNQGGMESLTYSPEDLAEYQRLKAKQLQLITEGKVMDASGNMHPEFHQTWTDFEKVRNRNNGMPPKQLSAEMSREQPAGDSLVPGEQEILDKQLKIWMEKYQYPLSEKIDKQSMDDPANSLMDFGRNLAGYHQMSQLADSRNIIHQKVRAYLEQHPKWSEFLQGKELVPSEHTSEFNDLLFDIVKPGAKPTSTEKYSKFRWYSEGDKIGEIRYSKVGKGKIYLSAYDEEASKFLRDNQTNTKELEHNLKHGVAEGKGLLLPEYSTTFHPTDAGISNVTRDPEVNRIAMSDPEIAALEEQRIRLRKRYGRSQPEGEGLSSNEFTPKPARVRTYTQEQRENKQRLDREKYQQQKSEYDKIVKPEERRSAGRPEHTPESKRTPVSVTTDAQAEDVRGYAATAVNAVLRHMRSVTGKNSASINSELGQAHSFENLAKKAARQAEAIKAGKLDKDELPDLLSQKDDLVSDVYAEYVKRGNDSDGMLSTLNRIAGRHLRAWLKNRRQNYISTDQPVGEEGKSTLGETIPAPEVKPEQKTSAVDAAEQHLLELEDERKFAVQDYGEGTEQVDEIDRAIERVKKLIGRGQEEDEGLRAYDQTGVYGHWIKPDGSAITIHQGRSSHEKTAIEELQRLVKAGKVSQADYDKLNIPLNSSSEVEGALQKLGYLRGVMYGPQDYYVNGFRTQQPTGAQRRALKDFGIEQDRNVIHTREEKFSGEGNYIHERGRAQEEGEGLDRLKEDAINGRLSAIQPGATDHEGLGNVGIALSNIAKGFAPEDVYKATEANMRRNTRYVTKSVEEKRGTSIYTVNKEVKEPYVSARVEKFLANIKGKTTFKEYLDAARDAGIPLTGSYDIDKGWNRYQPEGEGLPSEQEQQAKSLNPEWRQDQKEEQDSLYRPTPTSTSKRKFDEMRAAASREQPEGEGLSEKRNRLVRQYNDTVKEIKAGSNRPLGLRRVTAAEQSYKAGWSNGTERWDVSNIGAYERTAVDKNVDWNNPAAMREWREKYAKVLNRSFARKGEEIELDSNQILIPAKSRAHAELIAKHLPEPPFAVNAAERNPLLHEQDFEKALQQFTELEPNRIDTVKETSDFMDKLDNERYQEEGEGLFSGKHSFFNAMAPTFDKVKTINPELGDAFDKWEVAKRGYTGMRNEALASLQKFNPEDVRRVAELRREAFRNDNSEPLSLTGEDADINEALKKYYFDDIGMARKNLGLLIDHRAAGTNENYQPDMLNEQTIDLFVSRPNSPEALYAVNKWAEYVAEHSEGEISFSEAKKHINDYIDAIGGKNDNYKAVNFGAIRKAQGYGLPDELRELDPIKTLSRYGSRAASDLAMFQELESKPAIAAALKIPNPNTGKIPDHPNAEMRYSAQKEVRNAMKWVMNDFGNTLSKSQPHVNAFVRLVHNSLLGGATGLRDLASVPVNMMPYIHSFSDLSTALKGMVNFREHAADALRSGAKQPNLDLVQFNTILDSPSRGLALMHKAATAMRKWQGREALENFSRDITFAAGKELALAHIEGAKNGNRNSEKFIEKFGKGAEGKEGEEAANIMAANFTERNQGTYGGRGLPVGIVESQFAPFFSLQKWGVEKANVIFQDVFKPALTGENYVPLLTYSLGTILTGAAIQEMNKVLMGRKPQDPDIKEAIAKGDAKAYAQELATLMQLGNFSGIVGDVMKAAVDAGVRGKTARNVVSFPTYTAVADTGEKLTDMAEAIRQGENPWEVIKMFSIDMLSQNIQNVRALANRTVKEKDLERSDKFRDRRIYNELEGKPAGEIPKINKYLGIEERKFKQASTPAEIRTLLPQVLAKAKRQAEGNPEKLRQAIVSLKGNSYQTMPSPTDSPYEFRAYYEYLVKTQGKTEADKRVKDYLTQRMLNQQKSRLLPSLR